MSAVTRFINVDLDIRGSQDLNPLAKAVAAATDVLRCEQLDGGQWTTPSRHSTSGGTRADGRSTKTELAPSTLRRIADHDAVVDLTIYGPRGAGS